MSSGDVQAQKKALRARAREKIKAITGPVRAQASTLACSLLQRQEIWTSAKVVLVYWPLNGEVDLRPMIANGLSNGKQIVLPRYAAERESYVGCAIAAMEGGLVVGEHGVREPLAGAPEVPFSEISLALVPGLAFDPRGGRLGRGRGYYDRILAQVRGVKCGVAFDQQIEPELPMEAHDAPLDFLLTPSKFLMTGARSCK